MAGLDFFGMFDGSEYYAKRAKYRNEYRQKAAQSIRKYRLEVPLNDEHFNYKIPRHDVQEALQSLEKMRNLITYHKNKELLGIGEKMGECRFILSIFTIEKEQFITQNILNIWRAAFFQGHDMQVLGFRYGLKNFSDAKASNRARFETSYAMDLIDPVVIASLTASYIASVIMSYYPPTSALGVAGMKGVIAATIALVAGILAHIVQKASEGSITALSFEGIAITSASNIAHHSNLYQSSKNLSAGGHAIFSGFDNYANGALYKANMPGSNNFYPTQANNPSKNITPEIAKNAQINNNLKEIDEITQGRSHYDLAGNEGYKNKAAPNLKLENIKELKNDIEYKQNALKQHNQRLLDGFSELALYISSGNEKENNQKFKANEWLQAWYNKNYTTYKNEYFTYIQSKDFINELGTYNAALRFKGAFFSRVNTQREFKRYERKLEGEKYEQRSEEELEHLFTRDDPNNTSELMIHQKVRSIAELEYQRQGLANDIIQERLYSEKFLQSSDYKNARRVFFKNISLKKLLDIACMELYLKHYGEDEARAQQFIDMITGRGDILSGAQTPATHEDENIILYWIKSTKLEPALDWNYLDSIFYPKWLTGRNSGRDIWTQIPLNEEGGLPKGAIYDEKSDSFYIWKNSLQILQESYNTTSAVYKRFIENIREGFYFDRLIWNNGNIKEEIKDTIIDKVEIKKELQQIKISGKELKNNKSKYKPFTVSGSAYKEDVVIYADSEWIIENIQDNLIYEVYTEINTSRLIHTKEEYFNKLWNNEAYRVNKGLVQSTYGLNFAFLKHALECVIYAEIS